VQRIRHTGEIASGNGTHSALGIPVPPRRPHRVRHRNRRRCRRLGQPRCTGKLLRSAYRRSGGTGAGT
jgi:hypothetical protein